MVKPTLILAVAWLICAVILGVCFAYLPFHLGTISAPIKGL